MKRQIYLATLLLLSVYTAQAQEWLLNDPHIYNANSGNVGIGVETPPYKLSVFLNGNTFSVNPHSTGLDLHSTGSFGSYYQSNFSLYKGNIGSGVLTFRVHSNGYVGIGNIAVPMEKLHVADGNLYVQNGNFILDNPVGATLFTGTGSSELNRYFRIVNSTGLQTSSGLKAGGVLVADDYNFANPTKNDLVIKGKVGIGTTLATNSNNYSLMVNGTVNTAGLYVNDQLFVSSQWNSSGSNITYTGKVGIGTTLSSNPNNYMLAVNGKIGAKDVQIETSSATWPDYVFNSSYQLPSLYEVEKFIEENKHLQDVPSAKEIEKNGHSLGEMDIILLRKIEELTLYILQQQKEIDELKKKVGNR